MENAEGVPWLKIDAREFRSLTGLKDPSAFVRIFKKLASVMYGREDVYELEDQFEQDSYDQLLKIMSGGVASYWKCRKNLKEGPSIKKGEKERADRPASPSKPVSKKDAGPDPSYYGCNYKKTYD